MTKAGLSVVMSAHNEERVIGACLESVQAFAGEIVVVDSASSDSTSEIARQFGARVIPATNKLMLNSNKNEAIAAATHDWVLLLDPDEHVSAELAIDLRVIVASNPQEAGYWIPRRDRELGVWRSRLSPQLRLFRNGRARFPCAHIHEMVALEGRAGHLRGVLVHEPRQSLFEYVHKRNLYSEHRARYLHEHGVRFRRHRLLLRPPLAFLKSYVAQRGYRDGIAGLIIAGHAAYGTFLQDAKLWQLEASQAAGAIPDEARRQAQIPQAPKVDGAW